MKVDIWSDIVCPFCYIGKRRLEAVAAEAGITLDVTWHSFELDPNAPTNHSEDLATRLSKKYGRTLEQVAEMQKGIIAAGAEEGIHFKFDIARSGNSFNAHRIIHLATQKGLGNEAEERFFKAYFIEGEAIGDRDTVERLAISIGLDPAEVKNVLDTDLYADAVRQDEAIAQQELKVSGVPFFVFNNRLAVSGAQPREVFQQAFQQAAQ